MGADKRNWAEKATEIARDVLAAHAAEVDATGRFPKQSLAALREGGFYGLTVPKEFGGAAAGPRTFAAVARILAEQCPSTAMIYMMHVCAVQLIAGSHEFAEKASVLQDIVAGRHLSTLAFSEKGSRSHFWAPVSQAFRSGDSYRLNAEKSWVTSAGEADSYLVSTRTAGSTDPMASTLYYVPSDAAGLSVSGAWNGLGLRGNASAPMRLSDVVTPLSHRLTIEGQGFGAMIGIILPWFQLGSAAVCVGIARAATEGTRAHLLASKLEHLGQSLASLMNLRTRLAQMQIVVDTQQAFLEHVAAKMEAPDDMTLLAVLESKAAAAEAALEVTDLAMRTCGGAAFSKHVSVERNFRDARAAWVMAPTTDVLHDFIGKSLLGLPLF